MEFGIHWKWNVGFQVIWTHSIDVDCFQHQDVVSCVATLVLESHTQCGSNDTMYSIWLARTKFIHSSTSNSFKMVENRFEAFSYRKMKFYRLPLSFLFLWQQKVICESFSHPNLPLRWARVTGTAYFVHNFGDGNWREAKAWILLLARAVEINPLACGALRQFTQWSWIKHPTFQLSGGHFTTELLEATDIYLSFIWIFCRDFACSKMIS